MTPGERSAKDLRERYENLCLAHSDLPPQLNTLQQWMAEEFDRIEKQICQRVSKYLSE